MFSSFAMNLIVNRRAVATRDLTRSTFSSDVSVEGLVHLPHFLVLPLMPCATEKLVVWMKHHRNRLFNFSNVSVAVSFSLTQNLIAYRCSIFRSIFTVTGCTNTTLNN
jgi:hypothetical protein